MLAFAEATAGLTEEAETHALLALRLTLKALPSVVGKHRSSYNHMLSRLRKPPRSVMPVEMPSAADAGRRATDRKVHVMNREEFEADLLREGYQVFYSGMRANEVLPEHGHDWDARVMVIGGEITLTRDGKAETFRTGDSCSVPANYPHAEQVGPQGVAFIAGRRTAAA